MLDAILSTLSIMGWLGLILLILLVVNTVSGTVFNIIDKKESFSWKKMLIGIGKAVIFYASAVFAGVAFTMLPFINDMITKSFGVMLLSSDLLNTLSSVGVLALIVASVVIQGKKAIKNTVRLANMACQTEEITWKVEEE